MIGLALVGIGALFVWAAFTKRADGVFNALKMDLPHSLTYDPKSAPTGVISIGGSGSGGGKSSSSGQGQYQVPIQGPDGTTGTITVNASDPGAATQNAGQGGNTPIGDPVKVK